MTSSCRRLVFCTSMPGAGAAEPKSCTTVTQHLSGWLPQQKLYKCVHLLQNKFRTTIAQDKQVRAQQERVPHHAHSDERKSLKGCGYVASSTNPP